MSVCNTSGTFSFLQIQIKKCLVDSSQLHLCEERSKDLGSGNFGNVVLATFEDLSNPGVTVDVAVKVLRGM